MSERQFQMYTDDGMELGGPHGDPRQLIVEAMRLTRSNRGGGEMAGETISIRRLSDDRPVAQVKNGEVETL